MNLRMLFLLAAIALLFISSSNVENFERPNRIKAKLMFFDGLVFIIDQDTALFTKDTIDVFDHGGIGLNCIENRNGDFNIEEYNYFKEYRGRRPYFFDEKKDSIVIWYDARIFVFDAMIEFENYTKAPPRSQFYHQIEHEGKMYYLKCFTQADIKKILLIKSETKLIKLVDCYFSIK